MTFVLIVVYQLLLLRGVVRAPNCLSFKRKPSPPARCFRRHLYPLFINFEGITLCQLRAANPSQYLSVTLS